MAIMPCTRCGARYVGPSSAAYCTVLDGGERTSTKHKLCPTCYGQLAERLQECNCQVTYEATAHDDTSKCLVCAEVRPATNGPIFFATCYPAKDERVDYASPLHEACALDEEGTWMLSSGYVRPEVAAKPLVGSAKNGRGK
jgi:hypothetical protein